MPTLDEWLPEARAVNPGVPDHALTAYWTTKYGPDATPKASPDIPVRPHGRLPTLEKWLPDARAVNPNVPDEALEAYWQTNYGDKGAKLRESNAPDTSRGFKESFKELPQLAAGAVALGGAGVESVVGEGGLATGVKKWGAREYNRRAAELEAEGKDSDSVLYSWEEAKKGNFGALVDWAQHGVGYVAGQTAQNLLTWWAGGTAGKIAAKEAIQAGMSRMVAKEAARLTETAAGRTLSTEALTKAATANVTEKIGRYSAVAAVAAKSGGMEAGEIGGDVATTSVDEGRALTGEEAARAFGASIAAGALEFVADKVGIDLLLNKTKLGNLAKTNTGFTGKAARVATGAVADMGVEGTTEFAQTLIEEAGKGKDPFSEDSTRQAIEAAALGALGGAVVGGAGGMLAKAQEPEPVVPPPAPEVPPIVQGEWQGPLQEHLRQGPNLPYQGPQLPIQGPGQPQGPPSPEQATQGPSLPQPQGPTQPESFGPPLPEPLGPSEPARLGPTLPDVIGPHEPAALGPALQKAIGPSNEPHGPYRPTIKDVLDAPSVDEAIDAAGKLVGSFDLVTRESQAPPARPEPTLLNQGVAPLREERLIEPGRVFTPRTPPPLTPQEQIAAERARLLEMKRTGPMGPPKPPPDEGAPPAGPAGPGGPPPLPEGPLPTAAEMAARRTGVDQAAHEAATSEENDLPEPTENQAKAGNFKMGHKWISGLNITIQHPEGSTRSGTTAQGKSWSTVMKSHYGHIRGTTGADGEQVDIYLKPGTSEEYTGPVFIVDQVKPESGQFDEHKVIMGAADIDEARRLYRENYAPDWDGLGGITAMPMEQFKQWLDTGDLSQPVQDLAQSKPVEDEWKRLDELKAEDWKHDDAEPAATMPGEPVARFGDFDNPKAVLIESTDPNVPGYQVQRSDGTVLRNPNAKSEAESHTFPDTESAKAAYEAQAETAQTNILNPDRLEALVRGEDAEPEFDYTSTRKRPSAKKIVSDWKKAGKPKKFSVTYGETYATFEQGTFHGVTRWDDSGNGGGGFSRTQILDALNREGAVEKERERLATMKTPAEPRDPLHGLERSTRAGDGTPMVKNPIPLAPVEIQNAAEDGLLEARRQQNMKMGEYLATFGTMETVNVNLLTTAQTVVTEAGLRHFLDDPAASGTAPPPTALQYGPYLMLRDGNTRIAAAILRGDKSVKVRVVYVSEKKADVAPKAEPAEPEKTGGEQVIPYPYASGMNRKRDMEAAIISDAGLGVEIHELSSPGMDRIAEAIADGKPVFVDSGAFTAFKKAVRSGTEPTPLDFEKVFAKYNELSRRVNAKTDDRLKRALLMLVAPDVVGDQEKTLALIKQYAEHIIRLREAGHEIVVPFQRGPIDQYDAFTQVKALLEDHPFVVGIPSSAAAMSDEDLRAFLSHPYQPDRLHILGAVQSKRMKARMDAIRDVYVDDVPGVTADANIMRSKLEQLAGLTGQAKIDKIKDILDAAVPPVFRPQPDVIAERPALPAPKTPELLDQYGRPYNAPEEPPDADGRATGPLGEEAEAAPEAVEAGGVPALGGERDTERPRPSGERPSRGGTGRAPESGPAVQSSVRDDTGSDSAATGDDTPVTPAGTDYRITAKDKLEEGGPKAKFKQNIAAIRLVKQLDREGRLATAEEQAILVKYTGWGGMKPAFSENDPNWDTESAELRDLLTDEEYETARRSIQYAHYTDPQTIARMWEALQHMGLVRGTVLEPAMGTGHFFGAMPTGLKLARSGVEMDYISGRIAQHLYQRANIQIVPFQEAALPDNHFDVVIGNVPFSSTLIADMQDKELNRLSLSLHNYFFAKALRKVRPGGVIAFITSTGTMDNKVIKAREYFISQADLIAAFRLPNNTFKGIAHTEVTTDIILLRKRKDGEEPSGPAWLNRDELRNEQGTFQINEYFVAHPDHILGALTLEGSMYRAESMAVVEEGEPAHDRLAKLIESLPTDLLTPAPTETAQADAALAASLSVPENTKADAFVAIDGKLYTNDNGALVPFTPRGKRMRDRILGLIGIRDALVRVFQTQLDNRPDRDITAAQEHLNALYDTFVAEHGLINNRANRLAFDRDPDYPVLQALENDYDRKTETATKADVFTKRTVQRRQDVVKADGPAEALAVSLNETNRIDFPRMMELTGLSEQALQAGLKGLIFQDPMTEEWEPASLYLSGNVKQKLKEAKKAAKKNLSYEANVAALEPIIPKDLLPSQIDARMGVGWIPTSDIQTFLRDLLNAYSVEVRYSPERGLWSFSGLPMWGVEATQTWGTERMPAGRLIELGFNSQIPTVYDTDSDGKRWVNEQATIAAREKLQAIKDRFHNWVWQDEAQATRLAAYYNEHFNNTVEAKFDGSHLTTPGKNPNITLRPHQLNATFRALQHRNTLLAHEVGTGKTFTMAAIAMEARRLGLAKKPMIVVPNHLVEQWGQEFLTLYPNAKLLVTSARDFEKANRLKLQSRIATGDWDAVIVPFTSFSRLPISRRTFIEFMREQIRILERFIREEQDVGERNNRVLRQLEQQKERLEEKIKARQAEKASDNAVSFEQTGVDLLLVDEADAFKNLFFPTRMTRVAGLPNTESQRSFDMYMKTRYITKLNNGRGVVFATGTPISNSMAEVFTMQRYLQQHVLDRAGLSHFDAWARQFGEAVTTLEMTASGQYKQRTSFANFINVPELTQMFREVMDVVSGDDIGIERPPLLTGKPINVVATPGPALRAYVEELNQRVEDLKNKRPDEDNMLKITGDGRHAALDVRLRVPGAPEDKRSKVNLMVEKAAHVYHDTTPFKGTQLIFLDLSTPKANSQETDEADPRKKKQLPAPAVPQLTGPSEQADDTALVDTDVDPDVPADTDTEEERIGRDGVYGMIRDKLIALGVKKEDIAFVHDAKNKEQRRELFANVNSGKTRILLGSTEKMGAGMNVQKLLVALHDLDCPWRPRDLEQRHGRIRRFGNQLYFFSNILAKREAGTPLSEREEELYQRFKLHRAKLRDFAVGIYQYATEAPSFDVYMWQAVERKARVIAQVMRGDPTIRTVQDADVTQLSAAEMKAIASGNPLVMEKVQVDNDVRRYSLLKAAYTDSQFSMRGDVRGFKAHIDKQQERLVRAKADVEYWKAHPPGDFEITVGKTTYTDRTEAGEAIIRALESQATGGWIPNVARYRGYDIAGRVLQYRAWDEDRINQIIKNEYDLQASREGGLTYSGQAKTAEGMLIGLDRAFASSAAEYVAQIPGDITRSKESIRKLEAELEKPFEQEEKLQKALARQAEIDRALSPAQDAPQAGPAEDDDTQHAKDVGTEDPDAEEAETVQAAIQGKTVRQAAEWLAAEAPSEADRTIAKRLAARFAEMEQLGQQFSLNVYHLGDMVPGAMASSRGMVSLMKTGELVVHLNGADVTGKVGTSYETLLHELVHAATMSAVRVGNMRKNKDAALGQATSDLYAVTNAIVAHFNRRVKERDTHPLSWFEDRVYRRINNSHQDVDEILAWALSNRDMQAYLEGIPYEGKSLWTRFVEAIRRFLGLQPKAHTALSEVLRVTDALLSVSPAEVQALKDKQVPLTEAAQAHQAGTRPPTLAAEIPVMSKWDDMIRTIQDKNIDLVRLVESIQATGRSVSDAANPVLKEELYLGRVSKRTQDFLTDELKPLIDAMRLNKVSMADLDQYLYARHVWLDRVNDRLAAINPDREDNDALSGMTTAEARRIYESADRGKMDRLAARVDTILAKTRQQLVADGLESQETVDRWIDEYSFYVPLHRAGFEDDGIGTGTGRSVRGPHAKSRTGSTREATNILANIALDREKAIVRGEKMRPVVALANLIAQNPNRDIARLAQPTPITYSDPETGLTVQSAGAVGGYQVPMIKGIDRRTGTVVWRPDPLYKGRDNVVNFRLNGRDHAIVFNEQNPRALQMARALKDLDVGQLNSLLSAAAPVTRYMASINTQYNPVFGVVNFIRDVQFAMLTLSNTPLAGKRREIRSATLKAIRGIYQDARAVRRGEHPTSPVAQLWERFQRVGGPTGYRDLFRSSNDRANAIEHMLDPEWWQKTLGGKILTVGGHLAKPEQAILDNVGRPVFEWLSDYNQAMENAVRLGVFQVGLDQGMSEEKAASLAKNITVNFNKKGQITTQMGALYAFFNASVQGTARIYHTLYEDSANGAKLRPVGKKILQGGVLLGAMQAVVLAWSGFDDDEPPEWLKAKALIVPVPGTEKGYVSIPMPLGFNAIPSFGRLLTESLIWGKPVERFYRYFEVLIDAFSPVGGASTVSQLFGPTAVDPLIALSENKDWTGRRIYKEDFNKLKPTTGASRGSDRTTVVARGLADAINWLTGGTEYQPGHFSPTPDSIDYLLAQAAGGIGRETAKALQAVDDVTSDTDIELHQVPLLGRLAGTAESKTGTSHEYYENLKAINLATTEVKGRRAHREDVHGFLREHPEAKLEAYANQVQSEIEELNRRKRELKKRGASNERIRVLDMQIGARMAQFNRRVKTVEAQAQ